MTPLPPPIWMVGLVLPCAALAHSAPAMLLAQSAAPDQNPEGYLVSEKFDGVRAWWDGKQLRTRGGLPIAAPDWFVSQLPAQTLDGELWLGYGQFDAVSALVRSAAPHDARWRQVRYLVFELPDAPQPFAQRAAALKALVARQGFEGLRAVPQQPVPDRAALQRRLQEVLALGGEGLMLHRADAPTLSGRSPVLLKLKPHQELDAVVMAHRPGKGRFSGQTGALTVRDEHGRVFDVGSGLSDAQRSLPPPVGSLVTVRHQGWTHLGQPRFATLWRLREPGQ